MTVVAMGLGKFQRLSSCDFRIGLHICDLGIGLHIAPQELPITCSYYSILNNFCVKKKIRLYLWFLRASGAMLRTWETDPNCVTQLFKTVLCIGMGLKWHVGSKVVLYVFTCKHSISYLTHFGKTSYHLFFLIIQFIRDLIGVTLCSGQSLSSRQ